MWNKRFQRVKREWLLATFPLAIIAVFLSDYYIIFSSYIFDIGGMEPGMIIYQKSFLETGRLYYDNTKFPYISTLYTPLYFEINHFICYLLNTKPTEIREIYLVGRTTALIYNVFSFIFIYLIFRNLRLPFFIAIFFLAFFLVNISEHAIAARPDSLKDLLFILFFFFAFKWRENINIVKYIFLVLVAILAIYSKQDSILYIGIVIFIAFMQNPSKQWLLLGFAILGLTIIIGVTLNAAMSGIFFDNILFANYEFSFSSFERWHRDLIHIGQRTSIPLIIIFFAFIKCSTTPRFFFLVVNAIIAGFIGVLTSSKFGASLNYYTVYLLCVCLAAGYACKLIYEQFPNRFQRACLFILLLGLAALNMRSIIFEKVLDVKSAHERFKTIESTGRQVREEFNGSQLLPLDERLAMFLPFDMALNGYTHIFDQWLYSRFGFEMNSQLYLSDILHKVDHQAIINELDYIILEDNKRSTLLYGAFYEDHFYFYKRINLHIVYKNKNIP